MEALAHSQFQQTELLELVGGSYMKGECAEVPLWCAALLCCAKVWFGVRLDVVEGVVGRPKEYLQQVLCTCVPHCPPVSK